MKTPRVMIPKNAESILHNTIDSMAGAGLTAEAIRKSIRDAVERLPKPQRSPMGKVVKKVFAETWTTNPITQKAATK